MICERQLTLYLRYLKASTRGNSLNFQLQRKVFFFWKQENNFQLTAISAIEMAQKFNDFQCHRLMISALEFKAFTEPFSFTLHQQRKTFDFSFLFFSLFVLRRNSFFSDHFLYNLAATNDLQCLLVRRVRLTQHVLCIAGLSEASSAFKKKGIIIYSLVQFASALQ